eukprot:TRINITY_DN35418_c0_g1_i1.p1 TRINITY_DN35418_c0_g1~~TRINITY_DN35418_c0_g1_i1.p1  ORF type:complete len:1454 (+),score=247.56 TRINITY_DN35418_c0_g1_i1:190-4551(+)
MPKYSWVKSHFQQPSKDRATDGVSPVTVSVFRHEETEELPCLLSSNLKKQLVADSKLYKVILNGTGQGEQRREPRLYVRIYDQAFQDKVKGLSIVSAIAETAQIQAKDMEEVQLQLQPAKESEVKLSRVFIVVADRYLSKRDIWHIHYFLARKSGPLIYKGYCHFLSKLNATFKVDSLWSVPVVPAASSSERDNAGSTNDPREGGDEILSGQVDDTTELRIRTADANVFVYLQVSSELFSHGLDGRTYWQVLLECFEKLVDNALRPLSAQGTKAQAASEGNGHYVRMIMTARLHQTKPVALNCAGAYRGYPTNAPEWAQDCYDVFFEGFVRAMPPTPLLVARARQVLFTLHQQLMQNPADIEAEAATADGGSPPSANPYAWTGVEAGKIVQARNGNVFEALNMALDHFDNHHLDRMLRVTGQGIIILTAGNGVLEPHSTKLYELTHKRFMITSPTFCHLVCVRSTTYEAPRVELPFGLHGPDLPKEPKWLKVAFFPEAKAYELPNAHTWMESLSLPLERCVVHAEGGAEDGDSFKAYRPWSKHEVSTGKKLRLPDLPVVTLNTDNLSTTCNGSKPDSGSKTESGSTSESRAKGESAPSPSKTTNRKQHAGELWDNVRMPTIISHTSKDKENSSVRVIPSSGSKSNLHAVKGPATPKSAAAKAKSGGSTPKSPAKQDAQNERHTSAYSIDPTRFNRVGCSVAEMVNTMQDLVGMRLEVIPSALLIVNEETEAAQIAGSWGNNDTQAIPSQFKNKLRVETDCSLEWEFVTNDHGLEVRHKGKREEEDKADRNLVYRYSNHYIRRLLVHREGKDRRDDSKEPSPSGGEPSTPASWRTPATPVSQPSQPPLSRAATSMQSTWTSQMLSPSSGGSKPPWEGPASWIVSRRTFHLPSQPDWNQLDQIMAGNREMPPALPYPMELSETVREKRDKKKKEAEKENSSAPASPCQEQKRTPQAKDTYRTFSRDHQCTGWELRSSCKQHFYGLVPMEEADIAHEWFLNRMLEQEGQGLDIGVDCWRFAEANRKTAVAEPARQSLESIELSTPQSNSSFFGKMRRGTKQTASASDNSMLTRSPNNSEIMGSSFEKAAEAAAMQRAEKSEEEMKLETMRQALLPRFRKFKAALEDLCFGGKQQLNIEAEEGSRSDALGRGQCTLLVKDMNQQHVPSVFSGSRDWIGLMYDSKFVPPKFFNFVIQYVACSSIHLVHFISRVEQIAKQQGFRLLRLPICQLFPQPSPEWVWQTDRETNFDRVPFYPRRKLELPQSVSPEEKRNLYARLLKTWLEAPVAFVFMFTADIDGYMAQSKWKSRGKQEEEAGEREESAGKTKIHGMVFQRTKGWTLSSRDGLSFVSLRESAIYWYDSWFVNYECRDSFEMREKCLQQDTNRRNFFIKTNEILDEYKGLALQTPLSSSTPRCHPRPHLESDPTPPTSPTSEPASPVYQAVESPRSEPESLSPR